MATYGGERHGGHSEKAEHKREPEGWLDKDLHGEMSEIVGYYCNCLKNVQGEDVSLA